MKTELVWDGENNYQVEHKWFVQSTSDKNDFHIIRVTPSKKEVTCSCKSGRIRGYCKHIKFYKKLIKELMKDG